MGLDSKIQPQTGWIFVFFAKIKVFCYTLANMEKGVLYIVATPIGNLEDITLRALEVLKSVNFILCEDTRNSKNLLDRYNIKNNLISYHQHSDQKKVHEIISLLETGKNLALVTDAGTPGISDPGNLLIRDLRVKFPELKIVPIPGPSAIITALSVSGFPTDKFLFLGFPPHKNKRQKFFQETAAAEYTVCFYESSHRIEKCLKEIQENFSTERKILIGREITKQFETFYIGTVGGLSKMSIPAKGEFVVVISN